MVRSRTVRPYRQPSYSGWPGGRLCRGARHRAAIAAAIILGLATGGCSYKLGGFFGKEDPEQTSALKPITAPAPAVALPADTDLALTKAAVHDLLSRGAQDTSVPWENPRTGARGTVTPIAAAYTQDGFTCHDFLASYVREGAESWLQGEACRIHKGRWEVKSIRPLKKA